MAHIETQSLSKTVFKPTVWKRYINDIFPLWDISKPDIVAFFAEQVNLHALLWNSRPKYLKMRHSFQKRLYTKVQHSAKKWEKAILEVKTHLKRKPYSGYNFTSYHTPIVKAPVWQTRSLENPTNKLLWGSISDFKSAWWTEASHTIAIGSKTHRKEGRNPEAKQQAWKRNIAFRGTIPALSVSYKRSFNEKVEAPTKPATTLPTF